MYVIAGRANDTSAARAEFMGKQIEKKIPNTSVKVDFRHPDEWPEFLANVLRQFDFTGFPLDFPGPLIWTPNGDLIGSTTEFFETVYTKKFGLKSAEAEQPCDSPLYVEIAKRNMAEVLEAEKRRREGPTFAEKYHQKVADTASSCTPLPDLQTKEVLDARGPCMFLISVSEDLRATYHRQRVDARMFEDMHLRLSKEFLFTIAGAELSHLCLVHPYPKFSGQAMLIPQRWVQILSSEDVVSSVVTEEVDVKARREELDALDYSAIADTLQNLPDGVCTFQRIVNGEEFRHQFDTHIQLFHAPNYPTKNLYQRKAALQKTHLEPHDGSEDGIKSAVERGMEAMNIDGNYTVLVASSWALVAKIRSPESAFDRNVWELLPPMPPCCYLGVLVAPALETHWPETSGTLQARLVMSRGEVEEIDLPEAMAEPRISRRIFDAPIDLLGLW